MNNVVTALANQCTFFEDFCSNLGSMSIKAIKNFLCYQDIEDIVRLFHLLVRLSIAFFSPIFPVFPVLGFQFEISEYRCFKC
jgi:hypothetical protein